MASTSNFRFIVLQAYIFILHQVTKKKMSQKNHADIRRVKLVQLRADKNLVQKHYKYWHTLVQKYNK